MIEFTNVSFLYGINEKVTGAKNVSLTINTGECVLLCGESGCGKTTLTRLINGLIPHYYEGELSGTVKVDNMNVADTPLYDIARKVGSVFQNPKSQFFNVDTDSELAFACQNLGLPKEEIEKRVATTIEDFQIQSLMGRNFFALSGGEKQKTACASSSVLSPEVIVLDEPSSNLDFRATQDLKESIKLWKKQGKTIVIAEHRIYYLRGIFDKVVYLKDGEIKRIYTSSEFEALSSQERLKMGLRPLTFKDLRYENKATVSFDDRLQLKNLCFSYKRKTFGTTAPKEVLHIEGADIPKGEVVAIIGHNGAGKSTLARCICGLEKQCGTFLLDNKNKNWKERLKSCYLVMQDTGNQLFTESVLDEVLLSMENEDIEAAEKLLRQFDLLSVKDRHPLSLSGGQKQRAAIASAVASDREVIVLDEPTRGLDLRHMEEVANMLKTLKKDGKTLLVITHDLELILSGCSFVVEMDGGQIKDSYTLADTGIEKLLNFFDSSTIEKQRRECSIVCGSRKYETEGHLMDRKKSKVGLGSLMDYAGERKKLTVLGCILSGISSALSVVPYICIYFLLKGIFNSWGNFSDTAGIIRWGWIAVIVSIGSILIYFIGLLCTHSAAFRVSKNMKKTALEHIVELPVGYFNRQTSGRLRKIIDENTELTETFLAHQLPDMAGALVLPVAVLILLFTFEWRLALLCLLSMVIGIVFLTRMFGGKNAGFMKTYMDALEEMNSQAVEYVRGIPVVKVFQQTVFSFKNFHNAIKKYKAFASGYSLNSRVPVIGYTIASNGAFFLLIPAAILLLKNTDNPVQFLLDFIFYVLFSPLCASMMGRIMYVAEGSMQAGQALERLNTVLEEPVLKEPEVSKEPENTSVLFDDVSFTYAGAASPAADHVTFSIPAGKTVALVGTSGGGKTTVASLLPRFFDVNSGKICIGSVDVRDIKTEDLMKYVAFVFQDTHLFKASIRENIRVARPQATDDEIFTALHTAQCDDILEKLPNGIDTVIGEKGVYLSGGEQQRLALARAILKDAPITVLDEATAFADSENEAAIQKAFTHLTKNKTVLMIAHRLSTVKNADLILVMENGKIIERGTHQELLALEKTYAKMWNDYQSAIRWKLGKEA